MHYLDECIKLAQNEIWSALRHVKGQTICKIVGDIVVPYFTCDKDGLRDKEDRLKVELWFSVGNRDYPAHARLNRRHYPAVTVTCAHGTQLALAWYRHGRRHRVDGPAVLYNDSFYSDGDTKYWFIDGHLLPRFEYAIEEGLQGIFQYVKDRPGDLHFVCRYLEETGQKKAADALKAAEVLRQPSS